MIIKATHGDFTKRLTLQPSEVANCTYDTLQKRLAQMLSLPSQNRMSVKYIDDEEDIVTIACDVDLAEAFASVAESPGKQVLRLLCTVSDEDGVPEGLQEGLRKLAEQHFADASAHQLDTFAAQACTVAVVHMSRKTITTMEEKSHLEAMGSRHSGGGNNNAESPLAQQLTGPAELHVGPPQLPSGGPRAAEEEANRGTPTTFRKAQSETSRHPPNPWAGLPAASTLPSDPTTMPSNPWAELPAASVAPPAQPPAPAAGISNSTVVSDGANRPSSDPSVSAPASSTSTANTLSSSGASLSLSVEARPYHPAAAGLTCYAAPPWGNCSGAEETWGSNEQTEKRGAAPKPKNRPGCKPEQAATPMAGRSAARFVEDITIHDNTEILPGTAFTKIWKMRNAGQVPWPPGSQVVRIGGDEMGENRYNPVPQALPGQEVNVSVDLVAPAHVGRYVSYWKIAEPSGRKFGQRIWVALRVVHADSVSEVPEEQPARLETERGADDDADPAPCDGVSMESAIAQLHASMPPEAQSFLEPVLKNPQGFCHEMKGLTPLLGNIGGCRGLPEEVRARLFSVLGAFVAQTLRETLPGSEAIADGGHRPPLAAGSEASGSRLSCWLGRGADVVSDTHMTHFEADEREMPAEWADSMATLVGEMGFEESGALAALRRHQGQLDAAVSEVLAAQQEEQKQIAEYNNVGDDDDLYD